MDILNLAFSLAQQGAPEGGSSILIQLAPFGLLILAMYFLMIAPQRKKQKEHDRMVKELKAGDEVMTAAGFFGKVNSVKEGRIVVTLGENTKVEMNPNFVQQKIVRDSKESK